MVLLWGRRYLCSSNPDISPHAPVTSTGPLLNHQGVFGGQGKEPISHRHTIENMALSLNFKYIYLT